MKTLFEAVKSKALEYGFEAVDIGCGVGWSINIDFGGKYPLWVGGCIDDISVVSDHGLYRFHRIDSAIAHLDGLLSQYAINRDLSAQTSKAVDSPINMPKVAHSANGEDLEGSVESKHNHYYKNVENLSKIDIYRVLDLFDVHSHALGHAVKKIMCAGGRGAKDHDKDIQEAIDTLIRYQQMRAEDSLGAKK